jgi:phospholipid-binding lipoprotein MlaA
VRKLATVLGLLLVAGCAAAPDPQSLDWDPLEAQNREAHAVNVPLDRAVYGPVARGYGAAVPQPVRRGIGNLRDNWRLPGHVIQYGLQGRPTDAAKSTTRFMVNTIMGLGGLIDPATEMGQP